MIRYLPAAAIVYAAVSIFRISLREQRLQAIAEFRRRPAGCRKQTQ